MLYSDIEPDMLGKGFRLPKINLKKLGKALIPTKASFKKFLNNPLIKGLGMGAIGLLTGGVGVAGVLPGILAKGKSGLSAVSGLITKGSGLPNLSNLTGLAKGQIIGRANKLLVDSQTKPLSEITAEAKLMGFSGEQTRDLILSKKFEAGSDKYDFTKVPSGSDVVVPVKAVEPGSPYQIYQIYSKDDLSIDDLGRISFKPKKMFKSFTKFTDRISSPIKRPVCKFTGRITRPMRKRFFGDEYIGDEYISATKPATKTTTKTTPAKTTPAGSPGKTTTTPDKEKKQMEEYRYKKTQLQKQIKQSEKDILNIKAKWTKMKNLKGKEYVKGRINKLIQANAKLKNELKSITTTEGVGVIPILALTIAGGITYLGSKLIDYAKMSKEAKQVNKLIDDIEAGKVNVDQLTKIKGATTSAAPGGLFADLKSLIVPGVLVVGAIILLPKILKKK